MQIHMFSNAIFQCYALGPYKYPLLGNLPQLAKESRKGKKPYVVLKQLSKKYGHRMSLHFGATYQGIVKSMQYIKFLYSQSSTPSSYVLNMNTTCKFYF